MIDLLIFSKDRPCQAQFLLDSIEQNVPDGLFNLSLLYLATSDEYKRGYDLLKGRYKRVYHIPQKVFKNDVENWASKSNNSFIAFAVDDDVFFRDIKSQCDAISQVLPIHSNEVFSFRLGLNTVMQTHTRGIYQPPLNRYTCVGDFISWIPNEYAQYHNYGYPMSVDLHVFNKSLALALLRQFQYSNPTSLEGGLTKYYNYAHVMTAFKQSCVVNIPCNNVGGCTEINANSISCGELNDRYLGGEVIDLESLNGVEIIGTHQDIVLRFKEF